jgi:hypothetical protein
MFFNIENYDNRPFNILTFKFHLLFEIMKDKKLRLVGRMVSKCKTKIYFSQNTTIKFNQSIPVPKKKKLNKTE